MYYELVVMYTSQPKINIETEKNKEGRKEVKKEGGKEGVGDG